MCIIVMKERGIKIPNMEILHTCFLNNPDGAGILYQNPGQSQAIIEKGFMDWQSFENALYKLPINKKSRIVFHFRITTAGGTNQQNCHPFPISTDVKALTALKYITDKAIIHNGIIGQGTDKLSDTQIFIRDFVAREPFINALHLNTTHVALEAMTSGSRLVIFDGKHDTFIRTGKGWIKNHGLWFSNDSFMTIEQREKSFLDCTLKWKYGDENYEDFNHELNYETTLNIHNGLCPNCSDFLQSIGVNHALYECATCGFLYDESLDEIYYTGD